MQQDFLKMASKQTNTWLNAVKTGKGFDPEGLVEVAREAMETFVHTQKKFLDMIAEQTTKATSGKELGRKIKLTELSELAKDATDAFIDAQKKLIDVGGRQVNANMRAAGRTLNMIAPFPFIPIPDITREGVKSFVNAEKALIDTVMHRPDTKRTPRPTARKRGRRPGRPIKIAPATA